MKNFSASLKGMGVLVMVLCVIVGFGQTAKWTWMSGDTLNRTSIDIAVYGTQGVPNPYNKPPLTASAMMIGGNSDYLWYFGGDGYAESRVWVSFNDVWRYNIKSNVWTWMKGDGSPVNQDYSPGFYGTQGTSSTLTQAPSKTNASHWADLSGNLWVFSGMDRYYKSNTSTFDFRNDLWKYNILTNEWTWMKGDSTYNPNGVYGTKGQASPLNTPGGRIKGYTWTDFAGNLWLYGGYQESASLTNNTRYKSDLWKYNISTNEWTWMQGKSTNNVPPSYGTQGVGSTSTTPGGRSNGETWIDASGNFWLFGGWNQSDSFNDLWKYDVVANRWIWISGSNQTNQFGIYDSKGSSSPTAMPGCRVFFGSWIDTSGNFWLIGGSGSAATQTGDLSDIWKYIPSANQWTWVGGDSSVNKFPVYGVKGTPSTQNNPGGRNAFGFCKDTSNNIWLFGGFHNTIIYHLNDLWRYSTNTTLPLHLLTFTAHKQGNTNLLQWQTAQEINVDHFIVEKGFNVLEFSTIGKVKAGQTNYSFTDNNPTTQQTTPNTKPQTIYYRLKMVDKDGQYTYSPIRSINNSSTFSVSIYPNPAKDNLQIQIDSDKPTALQLQIISQDGKVLLSHNTTATTGSILRSINISALPKGSYFLKATMADKDEQVVKFEKQ